MADDKAEKEPQARASGGSTIDTNTAARLLMVTPQRVHQLVKEGWIAKQGKDQYRLVDVVQGYIKFRDDSEQRAQRRSAENRVRDARTREIEIRSAIKLRQLVATDEAIAAMDEMCGIVRSEFSGLPAAFTRDLVQRRLLDKEVNERFNRIAARLDAQADALSTGGASVPVAAEDDAGPVGGGEPDAPAKLGTPGTA